MRDETTFSPETVVKGWDPSGPIAHGVDEF